MKELTVLAENKPGVLAKISGILGKNGINIEGISAQTFGEGAIIRFLTKDYSTAKKLLEQDDYNVVESDVVLLELIDRPGELSKVSSLIAKEGINIESAYLLTKKNDKAIIALKVDRPGKVRTEFRKYLANY